MRLIYLLFLTIFIILPLSSFSQDVKVVRDLRLRNTLSIEKKITKKLLIFGEAEIGLEKDIGQMGKLHGEIGIGYSPLKFLSFESKYRYTKNRKNFSEEFKFTHLLAFSAEGKYKFNRLRTYYRLQYQNIDEEQITDKTDKPNRNLLKNRIKLKYNIKGSKLTPYFAPELYVSVGQMGIVVTKLKTIAGVEYEFNKNQKVKFYYRNDKEMTTYLPYMYHTLGLSYNLTF